MAAISLPFVTAAELLPNRLVRLNSSGDAVEYATDSARMIYGALMAKTASGTYGTAYNLEEVELDTAADLAAGTPIIGGTDGKAASGAALTGSADVFFAGFVTQNISSTRAKCLLVPFFGVSNS